MYTHIYIHTAFSIYKLSFKLSPRDLFKPLYVYVYVHIYYGNFTSRDFLIHHNESARM